MASINVKLHQVHPDFMFEVEPASSKREWMDRVAGRAPYHCLPLQIANQAGWVVKSPSSFTVTWNGLDLPGRGLTFAFHDEDSKRFETQVSNHFGYGILTFNLPFVIETPPGIQTLARGLPNYFKDGIVPLEGVIETDNTEMSFTMNWRFTRPSKPVVFRRGDPICMISFLDLSLLEKVKLEVDLYEEGNPKHYQLFQEWQAARAAHIAEYKNGRMGHYTQGTDIRGTPFPEHRKRLNLRR